MEKKEKSTSFLRRAALAACLCACVLSCKKDGDEPSSPVVSGAFTAVTENHTGDGNNP